MFITPENLLVGISGALGTKEKPFSKQKCVFEKMLQGISETVTAGAFKPLPLCSAPEKLTSRDYWSSRNTWKPRSKLKHVFRNCNGVSLKLWMLDFLNLCHCVQHPWKLTNRNFWSSRNERKPLSQLKHVFRKCSGVSQKRSMLELSNICHCNSAPLKNY